jgi:uncharacterized protein YjiS (DUF1127 family)
MPDNSDWISRSGTALWTDDAHDGADRAREALARALGRAWDELKAYYLRRQTRRLLERLSDRNLADIGLSRADLRTPRSRVRGWSWLPPWRV